MSAVNAPAPRTFWFRLISAYRMVVYVFGTLVIAGIPIAWSAGVRFVTTPSVPKGLWWVHQGHVERYGFVNACLPRALAVYGVERGFLDAGVLCPGRAAPVMKMVVAVPGDRVNLSKAGIRVNGMLLADSARDSKDHWGRAVRTFVPLGDSIVQPGEYWLLGLNSRSWDSRYLGPIPAKDVIGVGKPIFIEISPPLAASAGHLTG